MCCAAPAGVPRIRLALESRWILTIALSLKSLFTSARMSIIEATCARTSPELYLQCVADEQAGLSLGFDLANWTDVICVVYLVGATVVNLAALVHCGMDVSAETATEGRGWTECTDLVMCFRINKAYDATHIKYLRKVNAICFVAISAFALYNAYVDGVMGIALAQPIGIILALLSLLNVYSPNQDVAGVPFSDFKDHTAEKLGRRGNQFTWWDLFKSAPDLVLKKFAEAELGDRMEKSEKSATLGADPKVEKKEKKKSFFGKKKEGGDGKELV